MLRQDAHRARSATNVVSRTKSDSSALAVLDALTPVEERHGLLFKRDDLFRPLELKILNGGKLRQVMALLQACDAPGVITAGSIHSPQIPLVAGAAHDLGLRCVAVVGGTSMTPELNIASSLGAEIRRAASGRHRALFAEVARLNSTLGYYVIPYGIFAPHDPPTCLMTQARQAANLPDELDTLVVTCGSGVSTIGILTGLEHFSKRVAEVVLVGTAPRRVEMISNFVRSMKPAVRSFLKSVRLTHIDLFGSPGFRYERRVPYNLYGINLHPLYEAKAFRHVVRLQDCSSKRTLFWIIGADLVEPITGEAA